MKNILIGILFILIGIGVGVWGFITLQRAKASNSWPAVQGAVISSEVRVKHRSTSSTRRSSIGASRKKSYSPHITYEYTVNAKRYTADRLAFGTMSSNSKYQAEETLKEYPVGKEVPVYYDPNKPEIATLLTGVSMTTYVPLGIGIFFAVIGGAVALFGNNGKLNLSFGTH